MSDKMKRTIVAGIFTVIVAIIGGLFLVISAFIQGGFIVTGPKVQVGNPQSEAISSTPIVSGNSTQNRPTYIHLKTGQSATLADGWIWICIGDFSITSPNGSKFNYYDVGGVTTGLVIVFEANSRANLSAPADVPNGVDIGDCHPVSSSEKEDKLTWAIDLQLRQGCTGNGCGSVRIVEIDRNYNLISDYWK